MTSETEKQLLSDQSIKAKVKKSCRMEFIGTGFYRKLSDGCTQDPKLAKTLDAFSKHELKHGILFSRYYETAYGKTHGRTFWITLGKVAAFFQARGGLKKTLKKLHLIESRAVKDIEQELLTGAPTPYLEILKKILPDEKAHARLYSQLYPESGSTDL